MGKNKTDIEPPRRGLPFCIYKEKNARMGEEKIVMGFRVIEGGRAGGSTVYALKKAHAWHRGDDSDLARWCTDPYPPGIDLSNYYDKRSGGGA
jgi:hypothetical protein